MAFGNNFGCHAERGSKAQLRLRGERWEGRILKMYGRLVLPSRIDNPASRATPLSGKNACAAASGEIVAQCD